MKLWQTRCERGVHDFREAVDEVPNPPINWKAGSYDAEVLRAVLYHRVVRAIYCKRCGKQLPLEGT